MPPTCHSTSSVKMVQTTNNQIQIGVLSKDIPLALNETSKDLPIIKDGITLFTNIGCPYAQKAHITLLESGVSFEKLEIDLRSKPTWYTTVNPRSKVPALIDGDKNHVLIESALISQYIAEKYAADKLLVKDPLKNYVGNLWVDNVANGIGGNMFKILGNKDESKEEELKLQAKALIKEWNGYLTSNPVKDSDNTSPWVLGGDDITIHDILTIPVVARFVDHVSYFTNWDLEIGQGLLRWLQAWEQRDSFKETWAGAEYLRKGYLERGWAVKR